VLIQNTIYIYKTLKLLIFDYEHKYWHIEKGTHQTESSHDRNPQLYLAVVIHENNFITLENAAWVNHSAFVLMNSLHPFNKNIVSVIVHCLQAP
jgi:hypothetical protein